MNKRDDKGLKLETFDEGNVVATVWLNKAVDGYLYLKLTIERVQELSNGEHAYYWSFYPEDLGDLYEVVARAATWFHESGHVFLRGGNNAGNRTKTSSTQ